VDSPTAAGLTLGGHFYAVSIGPYIAPPYPSTNLPGILVANVTAKDVQTVPEPATLALACLALPVLGLNAWRKRRRSAPAAA
jgi:PEP-CTERM motif